MAAKLRRIGFEDDYVVRGPVRPHSIVFKRFARVEVENEESWAFLIDDQFVLLVAQGQILMLGSQPVQNAFPLVHQLVELAELTVTQILVTQEVPLAPAVVIAEVVALARKVDPLRMTELVAHEV